MNYAAIAAFCCCAWLTACSHDAAPPQTSAVVPHVKRPAAARKGPSAEELTAGMSAAATFTKAPLTADLKFELAERPMIGRSVEINLALVPKFDGGPASVQLSGPQGFAAEQDEGPFELAEVSAGAVYRHSLKVTPTTDGVLLVSLSVTLKHDELTDAQIFTVPLIVDR